MLRKYRKVARCYRIYSGEHNRKISDRIFYQLFLFLLFFLDDGSDETSSSHAADLLDIKAALDKPNKVEVWTLWWTTKNYYCTWCGEVTALNGWHLTLRVPSSGRDHCDIWRLCCIYFRLWELFCSAENDTHDDLHNCLTCFECRANIASKCSSHVSMTPPHRLHSWDFSTRLVELHLPVDDWFIAAYKRNHLNAAAVRLSWLVFRDYLQLFIHLSIIKTFFS